MFWKTAIAVVLTVVTALLTHSPAATIATFFVAMIIVIVFEGVRIVPDRKSVV